MSENSNGWLINSFVFKHPFTCLIVGPSGCGKTKLLTSILENKEMLVDNKIDKIIFCYKEYQPSYDLIKSKMFILIKEFMKKNWINLQET